MSALRTTCLRLLLRNSLNQSSIPQSRCNSSALVKLPQINLNRTPHILYYQNSRYHSVLIKLPQSNLNRTPHTTSIRYKGKTSKKQHQDDKSDTEKESEPEDPIVDKNSKVMNIKLGSLRLDGILKSGLGIARNKIEVMFYESKIRLNGEKVLKKSASVQVGDEIDVIKGMSPSNPKFLMVARVEVLNASPEEDFISMKIRRCKNLVIENYSDPWKASSGSSGSK